MARLAIRTDDFQLSFKLIEILRAKKLDFVILDINIPLPSNEFIWFAKADEILQDSTIGKPIPTDIETIESSVYSAMFQLSNALESLKLTIGIDPGPYPGLAWLVDGAFTGVSQLKSLDELVPKIEMLKTTLNCQEMIILIGDGAPLFRDQIINLCLAANWIVQQVNETKTSKGLIRNNHSISALRIATNNGTRVWQQRVIKPTLGEIKFIQGESRKLSMGELTISKQLAKLVACGEMSLSEAIMTHSSHSSEE